MTDRKISDHPAATPPLSGTEDLLVNVAGVTKRTTTQKIADLAPVPPASSIANAQLVTMGAATVKGSLAGGAPADLSVTQVRTLVLPTFELSDGTIVTATVTTYRLKVAVAVACILTKFYAVLRSGTATVRLLKNGTLIATSTINATGSRASVVPSGAGATFAPDDYLDLEVTAVASPVDLSFTVHGTLP